MAIQTQNTELDVTPGGIIPVVHVSQFDVNRVLTFTLMDGNAAAVIPSGTTVMIEGTKPSRKAFQYNATISSNVVTVNTTEQMTAEAGTTECKLELTKDSQVIGTALFLMEVEQSGILDSADISETVLPVYMEAGRQYMLGAEAWAKGTKDNVDVSSSDPQYHNNSKYFSEQSAASATTAGNRATAAANSAAAAAASVISAEDKVELARRWAIGVTQDGTNPSDTNNSKYYAGRSEYYYGQSTALLDSVNSLLTLIQILFGAIGYKTKANDQIVTKSGDRLVVKY